MNIKYYPVIKTTIAEIRALKNLGHDTWQSMTPIVELTKSRKGKNNQDASVYKKIDELCQVIKSETLILDLTTIDSLSNEQIESFYDDSNNFENWCTFVEYVKGKLTGVLPVLLAYPDSSANELIAQAEKLCKHTRHVVIRIPIFEQGLATLFNTFLQVVQQRPYLIHSIIFDASYIKKRIEKKPFEYIVAFISYFYQKINGFYSGKYIFCSEHYPGNITEYLDKSHNQYENEVYYGNFELFEELNAELYKLNIPKVLYGDYACIHPFRNDVKAYNWIPRIDFPTKNAIFFSKVRRDVGGYDQCARNIVSLKEFKSDSLVCWGKNEITQANLTKAGGLNPSYWISVRSNIHMSRMARIIKNN
ncbi:hypothetical protein J5S76_13245 [Bacillus amyloliquefaciens]|nr:hypothetical protein [Bacillus amyloliquefaciens]